MIREILQIEPNSENVTIDEFYDSLDKWVSSAPKNISTFTVQYPEQQFGHEIIEFISNNGFHSYFLNTISMEDIITPDMDVDERDLLISKFVEKLNDSERLFIIDPYFYAPSLTVDTAETFTRIITPISRKLREIVFITNGRYLDTQDDMHTKLRDIRPDLTIKDVTTNEFHDRFWFDPDRHIGIVMGTSLNGLGNKISLIDRLSEHDTRKLTELANSIIS